MHQNHRKHKSRAVYMIVHRNEQKYWTRIGTAFQNADGSINILIDAIPLNGELQIRDPRPANHKETAPRRAA